MTKCHLRVHNYVVLPVHGRPSRTQSQKIRMIPIKQHKMKKYDGLACLNGWINFVQSLVFFIAWLKGFQIKPEMTVSLIRGSFPDIFFADCVTLATVSAESSCISGFVCQ